MLPQNFFFRSRDLTAPVQPIIRTTIAQFYVNQAVKRDRNLPPPFGIRRQTTTCGLYVSVTDYRRFRPHLSLAMDGPESRAVQAPELGEVIGVAEIGGLHHHDERSRVA
jgi:hypothetical protein